MTHIGKRLLVSVILLGAALARPSSARAGDDACLEAVGGTSAGYVYSMYMLIGVTADAFTNKAYDAGKVKQLMTVGIKMLAESCKQLDKVKRAGLSSADRAAVEEYQVILGLLEDQARALVTYTGSGRAKDAERYEKTRQKAWRRITKLLGIEEVPAPPG